MRIVPKVAASPTSKELNIWLGIISPAASPTMTRFPGLLSVQPTRRYRRRKRKQDHDPTTRMTGGRSGPPHRLQPRGDGRREAREPSPPPLAAGAFDKSLGRKAVRGSTPRRPHQSIDDLRKHHGLHQVLVAAELAAPFKTAANHCH